MTELFVSFVCGHTWTGVIANYVSVVERVRTYRSVSRICTNADGLDKVRLPHWPMFPDAHERVLMVDCLAWEFGTINPEMPWQAVMGTGVVLTNLPAPVFQMNTAGQGICVTRVGPVRIVLP